MMDLADFTAVSKIAPQEERPDSLPVQPASVIPEATRPREIGGRDGPEPTRFGDWEKAGRCIDF
jgi:hypothetical protein